MKKGENLTHFPKKSHGFFYQFVAHLYEPAEVIFQLEMKSSLVLIVGGLDAEYGAGVRSLDQFLLLQVEGDGRGKHQPLKGPGEHVVESVVLVLGDGLRQCGHLRTHFGLKQAIQILDNGRD